jgi:DNA integrity scanning protein DisA with diadenylate cyclase activity
MYTGFEVPIQSDDNTRENNSNVLHPDVLKSDILETKLLIDNIIKDLSNNGKSFQDIIGEGLKDLKKKVMQILSSYRTSAESECHDILRTINETTEDRLSKDSLIKNLKKHSDSIESNLPNWMGWYKREYRF